MPLTMDLGLSFLQLFERLDMPNTQKMGGGGGVGGVGRVVVVRGKVAA